LVPGRRSSSLKASYEAINLGVASTEFSIGRELATAANSALAATSTDLTSSGQPQQARVRQHKLKLPKNPGMAGLGLDMMAGGSIFDSDVVDTPSMTLVDPVLGGQVTTPSPLASISSPMASLGGGGHTPGQGSDQEWNYDPNEPRYCICNQVSYGDMVACDNEDCPYEWFHYPCVGVTAPPKGKWYCQPCLSSAQRRRGRKN
jgi:inhibitor of growth protein 3